MPMTTDPLLVLSYLGLASLLIAGTVVIVPINFNLVATSFFTIYIGSHRSLYALAEETETMEAKDALMFPITAGCVLTGLYVLFQVFNKDMINMLISAYIFIVAVFATAQTASGVLSGFLPSEAFVVDVRIPVPRFLGGSSPSSSNEDSKDKTEDSKDKKDSKGTDSKKKKEEISNKDSKEIKDDSNVWEIQLTAADVLSLLVGVCVSSWYLHGKHWIANNIIGITFAVQGIENLSVGSYKTGAALLSLLFFYDIFFVFGTPVMVAVATNVDAPIKLLFPKAFAVTDADAQFSMLGLGDIVIPGIFIALLLRFDAKRAGLKLSEAQKRPLGSFHKPFFNAQMIGYCLGLFATLYIMYAFKHAQPALLYLVPACLLASAVSATMHGQWTELLAYSEEESKGDGDKVKTS